MIEFEERFAEYLAIDYPTYDIPGPVIRALAIDYQARNFPDMNLKFSMKYIYRMVNI